MLYSVIKHILRIYFPLFFGKIHIEGLDNVPTDKPVIFAVNHQNTLLDATLASYLIKRNTYYLVRSDLFKGRIINWFFKIIYLIPISRGKDKEHDMASFNKKSFSKCIEHLEKNKIILIFPEGESRAEYQLSKFKKGIARLALEAEDKNDFKLDINIVPVTINYENHFEGNSKVWIKYCEPITISEYQDSYKDNKARTVNLLLDKVEKVISEYVLQVDYSQPSPSFFNTTTSSSITSTEDLNHQFSSFAQGKTNALGIKKKRRNPLSLLVSIFTKVVFFIPVLFTLLLNRIINDQDFKLSVISFSLLFSGLLQVVIAGITFTAWQGVFIGSCAFLGSTILYIGLIKTFFKG